MLRRSLLPNTFDHTTSTYTTERKDVMCYFLQQNRKLFYLYHCIYLIHFNIGENISIPTRKYKIIFAMKSFQLLILRGNFQKKVLINCGFGFASELLVI